MKKFFVIILCVTAAVLMSACSESKTNSQDKTESNIEVIEINEQEALYLIREQYADAELGDGLSYSFTAKGIEEYNTKQYRIFDCQITDDSGAVIGVRPDVWVALDGSYVTTLDELDNSIFSEDSDDSAASDGYYEESEYSDDTQTEPNNSTAGSEITAPESIPSENSEP